MNSSQVRITTENCIHARERRPTPLCHNPPMPSDGNSWMFEHSVDCAAPVEFAWRFWTDVRNWSLDPDLESVELDGPFAAGARGVTNSKSSGRLEWRIAEAQNGRAVIEFPLSNATGRLIWSFEDAGGRTRITQRCTLEGAAADSYADAIGPGLKDGIPAGMQKLCAVIENAARSS